MGSLSRKQLEILEFIQECQRELGSSPSLREIGRHFDIASTNGVRYHLGMLEKAGKLERSRYVARGIQLSQPLPSVDRIPLLGRIAAGVMSEAIESVEQELPLDRGMFGAGEGEALFCLRVQGDSMVGAGILEDDLVLVRKDSRPRPGEIIVARLGGEATVKRFEQQADRILLHAENPAYEPIEITPEMDEADGFEVLGSVIGLIRTKIEGC